MEHKATKIKMAVKLLGSEALVMKMVREFDETAEELGRKSMVKEASKCTEELSIELNLEQPWPVRTEVCKCQVEKLEGEVRNQRWQGNLVIARLEDQNLSTEAYFWWLT